MSKILANQIANYGDDSPIEVKEGLNIPAGKPLQAAGVSGSNGQVLTSTGTSIDWTTPFDGDYNSLANRPTIPAAQVRADWNAVGTVSEILNKPIVPPVPSVTVTAVGSANLTYSAGNGQFTYTPPDLSSFATSVDLSTAVANSGNWDTAYGWGDHAAAGYLTSYTETDPVFSASPASDILNSDITNWDTAYGWGNHASVGYVTGLDMEDLGNVDITGGLMDQQVLKWDSASSSWKPANDLVGGSNAIELADLSISTAPAGSASLSYNNTNGVFTYTPPDLSGYATTAAVSNAANWDTAYGWGDHAAEGYLTAYTETDPVFTASAAAGITLTKINQWDTAYGWGNHANGGYLVATNTDKTNWNTAYGWGDHAAVGYLTAEADTLQTVLGRGNTTSVDIDTTGKIYYSNAFSLLTDLQAVSPSTYHGMFAHAHDTGHGYVAHAGAWIQLLDTGSSIGELADVDLSTPPSNGNILQFNGFNWTAANLGSVANATISDTAPGSPTAGDLWWESDKGRLKIYYNDTDSQQWVDASPPLQQDKIATSAAPATASSTGTAGEIRYDSGYVYICVATNTWKRAALTTW
jgi:hypothetical protein